VLCSAVMSSAVQCRHPGLLVVAANSVAFSFFVCGFLSQGFGGWVGRGLLKAEGWHQQGGGGYAWCMLGLWCSLQEL